MKDEKALRLWRDGDKEEVRTFRSLASVLGSNGSGIATAARRFAGPQVADDFEDAVVNVRNNVRQIVGALGIDAEDLYDEDGNVLPQDPVVAPRALQVEEPRF